MGVVQIKGRTTNSPENFLRYSSSSSSHVYTTALEKNIENFSIEISLGDGWNENYSDANVGLIKIDDSIIVGGRASIVVEVAEEIRVPYNRYGIVLPTGSLFLTQGLLIASAKVEPAFYGKLKLRLFNTTDKKIKLIKGRKLGSVIFFSTESTIPHDVISRNSNISIPPLTRLALLRKWFAENKITWIGWLPPIISAWLLGATMFVLYYKPALENKTAQPPGASAPKPSTANTAVIKDGK